MEITCEDIMEMILKTLWKWSLRHYEINFNDIMEMIFKDTLGKIFKTLRK